MWLSVLFTISVVQSSGQERFQMVRGLLLWSSVLWLSSCATEDKLSQSEELESEHIVIVGAGAAGLAAAKRLQDNGQSVQILAATDHFGGRVQKK